MQIRVIYEFFGKISISSAWELLAEQHRMTKIFEIQRASTNELFKLC